MKSYIKYMSRRFSASVMLLKVPITRFSQNTIHYRTPYELMLFLSKNKKDEGNLLILKIFKVISPKFPASQILTAKPTLVGRGG